MTDSLVIAPSDLSAKGRTFRVQLFSLVASSLSQHHHPDKLRPAYLAFAERESAVRAFTANLRSGRLASIVTASGRQLCYPVEIAKGNRLRWLTQTLPRGIVIQQAYDPDLFDLEPAALPEKVEFLFAPSKAWVAAAAQDPLLADIPVWEREEAAAATLFAAYLDRRSPMPVIRHPRFALALWRFCRELNWCIKPQLNSGIARHHGAAFVYPDPWPGGGGGSGRSSFDPLGFWTLVAVKAEHKQVAESIKHVTHEHLREHGPDWLREQAAAARVLVPAPSPAMLQVEVPKAQVFGPEPQVSFKPSTDTNAPSQQEEEPPRGEDRIEGDRGVLPDAPAPGWQASLFDLL